MSRPQTQTKDELKAAIIGMGGEDRLRSSMSKADLQHLAEALLLEHDPDAPAPQTIGDLRDTARIMGEGKQADVIVEDDGVPLDGLPTTGTDVELHEQPSTLPTFSRWQQMEQMAARVARSNLVPDKLRGKEADVLLIMLGAHDLGITATQGLQKLHVIDGKVGMAAELMVALVLGRGHELWPDPGNDEHHATAHGRRKGSDQVGAFTFTMDDANRAGLPARARGTKQRGTWDNYPKAMLWARAVSGLARQMFPDVLAGISYTPEELGAIDAEGYEAPVTQQAQPERPPAADDVKQSIRDRLAELTGEQRACVAQAWKDHEPVLFPLNQLHADEVGAVMAIIANCVQENPPDAEVVPDGGPVADAQAFVDGLTSGERAGADAEARDALDAAAGLDDECAQCRCIEPLNDDGLCADCAAYKAAT